MEGWKKYSAKSYLRERFKAPDAYRTEWPLQCFHEFYSKYHGEWDTTSARPLEFGGGPTIYGLISASGYVSEIVFSDYVEENRKAVEEWKNAGPCGYDWGPYFKYVVEKLEDDQSLYVWGAVCVKTKMLAVTYVFRERSYSRRRSCMDTVFHGDDFYSRRRSCMDTVFHGDDFYSRRRSFTATIDAHSDDLRSSHMYFTATIYSKAVIVLPGEDFLQDRDRHLESHTLRGMRGVA